MILAAIFICEVIPMIERLMNPERPYGEPAYSEFSEQINQLQQAISEQLSPQTKEHLEQLADTYIRRETAALHDAFADGFCAAIQLMLDLYRRDTTET